MEHIVNAKMWLDSLFD